MLRKIIIYSAIVLTLYANNVSYAARVREYTGPLLRQCGMYQIGENELILNLSGRNLPSPEYNAEDKALSIILRNTKIYHPDKIKQSLYATIESVPMIYGAEVENISDDKSFSGKITLGADRPLKVLSVSRKSSGWSFRIKSENASVFSLENAYNPPSRTVPVPETTLPFRVNSRITLELRDAELMDVLRGIMSYIGRNIIIDPSFPKDVLITMTLDNVRADEILGYFMRTYDLACYKSGANTLTFGTREGLYRLSGEESVKSFKIHFADPAQVSSMLKSLAALDDKAVTVDDRMKTVHVKTNPAKMQEAEELISVLDAPQGQVMIRASIFEFNDNDTLTVENALNIAYDDIMLSLGSSSGIIGGYRIDRSIRGTRTVWTDRVISGAFHALETKAKGKVLANPSVIALDGKQAEINLTQDYPYVSDRDNEKGTVTWSTEEVGPKLKFTPRIGGDGYVTLELDLSTGDVIDTQTSSTGEQMPVTTTRSVKTQIRVRDGMPFIIGGLFREDLSKNVSKIPILGNIPLLGELFTYRYNTKQKTQVVMVITPYILDSN